MNYMFDDAQKQNPLTPTTSPAVPKRGPEDIFNEVGAGGEANKNILRREPVRPGPLPAPLVSEEPIEQVPPAVGQVPSLIGKRLGLIAGVLILLVLLGIGGWLAWSKIIKPQPAPLPQEAVNNNVNQPETPGNSSVNQNQNSAEVVPSPVVDSDGDGLSDTEEQALGTNPNNPDTDNDGLSDRAEVKIYHTNPLDPDTDHDGYLDGQEVQGGFDPKGPGKLIELPNVNR